MSVNQVRGYWTVYYRDEHGKSRTRTFGKGRKGKKRAEAFDLEVKYKKAHGEALPMSRAEGVYLDELCQLWVNEKKAQGRAIRWLKEWADTFNKNFLDPLTRTPAHGITQAQVLAIISAHYAGASQATRNRYIGYLKSILQYGVDQGHLQANPLAKWKKGKEPRRKSPLTLDDLGKIKKHAAPHLAWALDVAWAIPARPGPSDLFALKFDTHVKWDRGGVEVYHSKVGRWAFVECPEWFMRALYAKQHEHQRSGRLIEFRGKPVQRIDTALDSAAEKAGVKYEEGGDKRRVCLYDVRHLWITTALDKGVEPSAIAYLAGTSVEMIHKNYYEPHAAARGKAARVMPYLPGEASAQDRKVVNIEDAKK